MPTVFQCLKRACDAQKIPLPGLNIRGRIGFEVNKTWDEGNYVEKKTYTYSEEPEGRFPARAYPPSFAPTIVLIINDFLQKAGHIIIPMQRETYARIGQKVEGGGRLPPPSHEGSNSLSTLCGNPVPTLTVFSADPQHTLSILSQEGSNSLPTPCGNPVPTLTVFSADPQYTLSILSHEGSNSLPTPCGNPVPTLTVFSADPQYTLSTPSQEGIETLATGCTPPNREKKRKRLFSDKKPIYSSNSTSNHHVSTLKENGQKIH